MGKGYDCGYCGKNFKTPIDRGRCEVSCEAEIKKSEQLKEDRSKRYNEIQEHTRKLTELINTYNKDYHINLMINYERSPFFDLFRR